MSDTYSILKRVISQWYEWLPRLLGAFVLLIPYKLAQVARSYDGWFREQHDFLSLIQFVSAIGAFLLLFTFLFALFSPRDKFVKIMFRAVSVLFFVAVGFKVSCRYVNVCTGIHLFIEYLVLLGTPVLVGIVLILFKRRVLGYVTATLLLVIVWFLAGPYMAWVHSN